MKITKQQIKDNILLAHFMEFKSTAGFKPNTKVFVPVEGSWYAQENLFWEPKDLDFHSDYNWIMPVIDRIKYISDYQEDFLDDYYLIDFKLYFLHGIELWIDKKRIYLCTAFGEGQLLDALYGGVIAFVNWFNEHKKK